MFNTDDWHSNNKFFNYVAAQYIEFVAAIHLNPTLLESIMIGKRHVVAIASLLSLTALSAHAAEPAARLKTGTCSTPSYTADLKDEDMQGTVRLAVLVDADGSVKQAKVLESSGHRALDRASLRASYSCKFGAAAKDSDGAPSWSTVQYKWIAD
jgi:TonB family protein